MPEDQYREFSFMLRSEGEEFDEDAIDRIMYTFIDAVEEEGYTSGGSICPPPPEERVCQRCEGAGQIEPIPEEKKCPTCDGSGEVDPDSEFGLTINRSL